MLTSNRIVLLACVLLPLAGGCNSQFAGDWIQESETRADGTLVPITAGQRMAIQFTPPTSVRIGMYIDEAGVVEEQSVASSDYSTLQNRSVAQFGAYTARVIDGQLVTYIGAEESGRFRRVEGQSVFPSRIKLPNLVRADQPAPTATALAVAE
jgi:hypothetical protein